MTVGRNLNYYSTKIVMKDGLKHYGDLPYQFVIGYENPDNDDVIFALDSSVDVSEYTEIAEISKGEYESRLQGIETKVHEIRKKESQDLILAIKIRNERLTALEAKILLTASDVMANLDTSNMTVSQVIPFKIAELKEKCTNAIYDGFKSTSTGYSFGFNELDQTNFNQMATMIALAGGVAQFNDDIDWKTTDGKVVDLTATQFVSIITEAKDHKMAQQVKYWTLEANVHKATTVEEVVAIKW